MLFIVPTPTGNLKDITLRAVETLKECDIILCEDTRRTLKLLSHLGISKKLVRYNEYNERDLAKAFSLVRSRRKTALVSDGGTPCISDPGRKLISLCHRHGVKVVSLPGPSALTAAAAGSGMPADSFVFLGFISKSTSKSLQTLKKNIEKRLTVILYESPRRVTGLLSGLEAEFGDSLDVVAAREISKIHEEWIRGTPKTVMEKIKRDGPKGEFVILMRKNEKNENTLL